MKKALLILITCCWCCIAISAESAKTKMLNPQDCFRGPFETHDKWLNTLSSHKKNFNKEGFLKAFPKSKFDGRKANLECVDFIYQVDGFTVEGYYLKPNKAESNKLPVVIYNRGGNGPYGYVFFGKKMDFIADIAAQGYVVIGSQYRGSSKDLKNNGFDEFGGSDVNDVVALQQLVSEIPNADPNNIALVGWSRGAKQAYQAAREMPQIKTIVAIAGNADVEAGLKWRPKMENVYNKRVKGFAVNRKAEVEKRSVIKWIDELPPSPILLIHGDKDVRVNVEQSKNFAMALAAQNHPHKLVVYEQDGHALFNNRAALLTEVSDWLKNHM